MLKPILQNYEHAMATVKAAIVLHNYLRERMPDEELQVEVNYFLLHCDNFVTSMSFKKKIFAE